LAGALYFSCKNPAIDLNDHMLVLAFAILIYQFTWLMAVIVGHIYY
jgi:hypothetical protein